MNQSEQVKYPMSVNLTLWLSVALFLIGIVETFSIVEVVPETFRFTMVGPSLVIIAISLFTYPLREIKKELKKHKDNNDS